MLDVVPETIERTFAFRLWRIACRFRVLYSRIITLLASRLSIAE
jgi:hypothetical protein